MFAVVAAIVTAIVGAIGVWWYLRQQARQKEIDERAATLFKPRGVAQGTASDEKGKGKKSAADRADEPFRPLLVDGALLAAEVDVDDEVDDEEGPLDGPNPTATKAEAVSRLQKRKMEKLREKEERKAQLAALEVQRRAAREAADQSEAQARDEEKKREDDEAVALSLLRDEKRRKDDLEFQMWSTQIGLESKGELGAVDAHEARLKEFLCNRDTHTKEKVLVLEDVSRTFQVSVEKLVSCIENLVQHDVISGVFDDRGKFIFVSDAELSDIAKFLRHRGRLSIAELIREANRIVSAPGVKEEEA